MHVRHLGFGRELCIHPKQVPIVNECLRPSPDDETNCAIKVTEAAAVGGVGAFRRAELILSERHSDSIATSHA
jgi:citrate lyase beta subunit